jgi:hypothetical protein
MAANGKDNSFFVAIDGNTPITWHTEKSEEWIWDVVGGAEPMVSYLEAGQHSLTIYQREDGTKIDKILITSDFAYTPEGLGGTATPLPIDTDIIIEAEDGLLNNSMQAFADETASENGYIGVPNGQGNASSPSQDSGYASFSFSAPTSGDYIIWGRIMAANGKDNSFFVAIDGNTPITWHTEKSEEWIWDVVGGEEPMVYNLEAGQHTLTIYQREDGTKIDKLAITKDLEFVPEG